ncbi:uncharacterized protein LOC118190048 [Stegodyphus dumicola]|uniref:uncharacterized protein LOC118190048 n=1 Tax=Stegodyphus dumicola TaxID=202533 RepID=UPI0015A8569E|nr:uncharacterized protein LOC118190048 [Stegodyphus dumicola]
MFNKDPEAFPVNHLSVLVEELVALINMLHESNLRCLQFQMHASLGNALPSDIISKAVVSHLQTSCYSVVIGGSEFIINQVLRILSLVSSKRESSSSLSITQLSSQSYIRGLYIQGAIKDVEKGVQCLLDKAYEESSPLTVIDADLFKVWQTITVSENAEKEKNPPSVVTETGCLVPDLINDILSFEKYQGDCTSLIQGFTRSLMMKATSLVKIVYHFRECGKLLSKSDLMTMCGLRTFEDLHVLLGYAEKIKPGISSYLL